MITEVTELVQRAEQKIIQISCDKCGKELDIEHYPDMPGVSFILDFGYSSTRDGDILRVTLCNDCMEDFLLSLKTYDTVLS